VSDRIKIFCADDHPIFRHGLCDIIRATGRFDIIGEAADGPTALKQISTRRPDIAVLDIHLPGLSGLDLARALQKLHPPVPVLILTMSHEEELVTAAIDAGVAGYVLKDNAAQELVEALRSIALGDSYFGPHVSRVLLKRSQRQSALATARPEVSSLSPMERRVLKLLAENKTSKQIGEELFVSHRTIQTHRQNICEKLGLHGPNALLQFALEHRAEL
jgi:DNA-binding NarL/FixJ family response regulator